MAHFWESDFETRLRVGYARLPTGRSLPESGLSTLRQLLSTTLLDAASRSWTLSTWKGVSREQGLQDPLIGYSRSFGHDCPDYMLCDTATKPGDTRDQG